jgi:CheY-like chemotaxis protein
MKVLVVDDSKTVQRINSQIVQGLGHEAVTASDGALALTELKKHKDIELILLDVNMPNMNGFEFLDQTKEYRVKTGIRVFMCTTEGGKEEVIKALKLGANNYIVKPIKREVLEQKIKELE